MSDLDLRSVAAPVIGTLEFASHRSGPGDACLMTYHGNSNVQRERNKLRDNTMKRCRTNVFLLSLKCRSRNMISPASFAAADTWTGKAATHVTFDGGIAAGSVEYCDPLTRAKVRGSGVHEIGESECS